MFILVTNYTHEGTHLPPSGREVQVKTKGLTKNANKYHMFRRGRGTVHAVQTQCA